MLKGTRANQRYIAYCVAHGSATPSEQAKLDDALPGDWPTPPFVHWVGHRLEEWCEMENLVPPLMDWDDHARFNDWLAEGYPVTYDVR